MLTLQHFRIYEIGKLSFWCHTMFSFSIWILWTWKFYSFLKPALLYCNLHTINFINFKCTILWILTNIFSQVTTTTTINIQKVPISPQVPAYLFASNPHPTFLLSLLDISIITTFCLSAWYLFPSSLFWIFITLLCMFQ